MAEATYVLLRSIRQTLRTLVIATVVLALGLSWIAFKAYHDAHSTQTALCALRLDLETRVQSSKDFLIDHPDGFAGIPAAAIRDGLKNQQRTIAALSGLSC